MTMLYKTFIRHERCEYYALCINANGMSVPLVD